LARDEKNSPGGAETPQTDRGAAARRRAERSAIVRAERGGKRSSRRIVASAAFGIRVTPCSRPRKEWHMSSGAFDDAKGRAKEATGDVTGDKDLKREGKVDRAVGKVKDKADEVGEKIKDKF
jgi:uncharacterized protein YjbJ (UPF0337 family)